jgi:hypothetical protein
MGIEYKIEIENSDIEWIKHLIESLLYFDKYNSEYDAFEFRNDRSVKYPSVVMEPKEYGMVFIDYLGEGIGLELVGLIVEKVTGQRGYIKIDKL